MGASCRARSGRITSTTRVFKSLRNFAPALPIEPARIHAAVAAPSARGRSSTPRAAAASQNAADADLSEIAISRSAPARIRA